MVRFVPRGRPELRYLLGPSDLDHAVPSTLWDQTDERTWRTGLAGGAQPAWQAAAHEAGSISSARTFTSEDGHRLVLVLLPLAEATDAAAALAAAGDPDHPLRSTRPDVVVTGRAELDPPPDVAGADLVTATAGSAADGEPVLTLRAAVGAFLVVAVASGPGWTWPDLTDVVAAQLARIAS